MLTNILLTPFDWEMRARGYQLTRYEDNWAVTCTSEAEAAKAIADTERILAQLGMQLHAQKTRIVAHQPRLRVLGVQESSEGDRALRRKLGRNAPAGTVYAYPSQKSINRFNVNPAFEIREIHDGFVTASSCGENSCHPEGELRRSSNF